MKFNEKNQGWNRNTWVNSLKGSWSPSAWKYMSQTERHYVIRCIIWTCELILLSLLRQLLLCTSRIKCTWQFYNFCIWILYHSSLRIIFLSGFENLFKNHVSVLNMNTVQTKLTCGDLFFPSDTGRASEFVSIPSLDNDH